MHFVDDCLVLGYKFAIKIVNNFKALIFIKNIES